MPTKNLFLAFPWIFHATELAWWDRPSICKNHWWDFVCFDYPKQHFDIESFVRSCMIFIEKYKPASLIICWISFGEVVAKKLMEKNTELPIALYISVCWASNQHLLSQKKQLPLKLLSHCDNRITRKVGKAILQSLRHIETKWNRQPIAKNNFYRHDWLSFKQQKAIMDAGSQWLWAGLYDRCMYLYTWHHGKHISHNTVVIYSTNDDFFTDPYENATSLMQQCSKNTSLVEVGNGGHASLVEFPEKRNPVLENILRNA